MFTKLDRGVLSPERKDPISFFCSFLELHLFNSLMKGVGFRVYQLKNNMLMHHFRLINVLTSSKLKILGKTPLYTELSCLSFPKLSARQQGTCKKQETFHCAETVAAGKTHALRRRKGRRRKRTILEFSTDLSITQPTNQPTNVKRAFEALKGDCNVFL